MHTEAQPQTPSSESHSDGEFVLVIHPEEPVARHVTSVLTEAGFRVTSAASYEDAEETVRGLRFSPPAVLLTVLDGDAESSPFLEQTSSRTVGSRRVGVVGLGTGDEDDRRRALRLGLAHLIPPPYDAEELVLSTRRALDRQRREERISGSLSQLSAAELLQTAEGNRRSGVIALESQGRSATVWLRDGRVVDAKTHDGREAEDAVYVVATWEHGAFEAEFGPISVPERIETSTTSLLLEAMRRKDEDRRHENLPHAAMPDAPPPPPTEVLTVHRALTWLNVATSYATDYLAPSLVARRAEDARQRTAETRPAANRFRVRDTGQVAFDGPSEGMESLPTEDLVEASVTWLVDLFRDLERARPGPFTLDKLRSATEAVADDLADLGFYDVLERNLSPREDA